MKWSNGFEKNDAFPHGQSCFERLTLFRNNPNQENTKKPVDGCIDHLHLSMITTYRFKEWIDPEEE